MHASGENVLLEKPAAQMLCFQRVPMGGNFKTQRHQQLEECLSHGERDHSFFMLLYSTNSLVLLGAPAETQSQCSWDKSKGFGVSIQLEMGRSSIMPWLSQVGLGCYPGMSLYPGKAAEGSRSTDGAAPSCDSWGLSLIPCHTLDRLDFSIMRHSW